MEGQREIITTSQSQLSQERSPALNRILNRTSARMAAFLGTIAALTTTSCGGRVEVDENIIVVNADAGIEPDAKLPCRPIPDCPTVPVSGISNEGKPNPDYYFQTNRWYRINPQTKQSIKVCEPFHRAECTPEQDPVKDNCDLPVCPDAKSCDPVPARNNKEAPYRYPYQADIPTTSSFSMPSPYYFDQYPQAFPVIFDNVPDCAQGESPKAESYLTCDPVPTCAATIPYCDPLPRCAQGESPISCEESEQSPKYATLQDCVDGLVNTSYHLTGQGIRLDVANYNSELCEKKYDSSINETYYQAPLISVNCRHIPECANGEIPHDASITFNVTCGKWFSGQAVDDYSASCDPIKSCKK